jgi:predicted AlkP superfamily pyrophosphatase or phosphodiesterase
MLTYNKYLALFLIIVVNNLGIINNSKINPLLVISLDGLRADKFDLFSTTKNSFIQKEFIELGVKAKYTIPSFPTVSFPNHFSFVTGMYIDLLIKKKV